MSYKTIKELKAMAGQLPKKTLVRAKVIEALDGTTYRIVDSTDVMHFCIDENPGLARAITVGQFVRIISPAIAGGILMAKSFTILSSGKPFQVKDISILPSTSSTGSHIPYTTLRDVSMSPINTTIGRIVLKIMSISNVEQKTWNRRSWIRVKDQNGDENTVSLWDPHCFFPLELLRVYSFRVLKVDNFPPDKNPKRLSSTYRSIIKEATTEEMALMQDVLEENQTIKARIVDLAQPGPYFSCPFCKLSLKTDLAQCRIPHCGKKIPAGTARPDFRATLVLDQIEPVTIEADPGLLYITVFKYQLVDALQVFHVENLKSCEEMKNKLENATILIQYRTSNYNGKLEKYIDVMSIERLSAKNEQDEPQDVEEAEPEVSVKEAEPEVSVEEVEPEVSVEELEPKANAKAEAEE
jgi:hypothetical protein